MQLFGATYIMWIERLMAGISHQHVLSYNPIKMRQDLKKPCPFFIFLFISEDDIMSSRSIRNHCDRISDFFFDKLNVVSAVLRKIFVFLDSSDVAFPSRKCLEYWFCFLKKMCCREFCCNFSVNLVSYTYRNFIQVSKYINNSKCYIVPAVRP